MELIRGLIEWIANDSGSTAATLFPYLLVGLLALYILWLVVGYLRVSQVGLAEGGPRPVVPLTAGPDAPAERPRGTPYCAHDGLVYPVGAAFCTACERDLLIDCATCGATVSATDASCYRCGTPTGAAAPALPG